ncbi:MAG: DUF6468 domain-containing protein [Sneathiellales bacterium]|nr:DUF6468 domain-containing protein [Sneathiellales bacterium]
MDIFSVPLILDLLLIALLGATITYCVRLNRKLSVMREAQAELHQVAAEFDQAIVRSRLGIEELKKASQDAKADLKSELEIAKPLIEELKLVNASGSRIADRIQDNVSTKPTAASTAESSHKETLEQQSDQEEINLEPRTEAERELLQMLTRSS